jgi:hypothetical protein
VEPGRAPQRTAQAEPEDLGPVPFHIKAFGVAAVLYLGWRLGQGIDWLIRRIF